MRAVELKQVSNKHWPNGNTYIIIGEIFLCEFSVSGKGELFTPKIHLWWSFQLILL